MKRRPKMSVIIAAAGAGRRMGGVSKPFMRLGRKAVLAYALETFSALPETREIILVVNANDIRADALAAMKRRFGIAHIVPGGMLRQESVANGLACVAEGADLIAVHDAARPLVTAELIRRVIKAALAHGAAIPAAPVKDTLKRSDKKMLVAETVPRDGLWQVQTPQIFDAKLLRQAYKEQHGGAKGKEGRSPFTDDAQLVERMGVSVAIVPSDHTNIKITTPEDLHIAAAILRAKDKY